MALDSYQSQSYIFYVFLHQLMIIESTLDSVIDDHLISRNAAANAVSVFKHNLCATESIPVQTFVHNLWSFWVKTMTHKWRVHCTQQTVSHKLLINKCRFAISIRSLGKRGDSANERWHTNDSDSKVAVGHRTTSRRFLRRLDKLLLDDEWHPVGMVHTRFAMIVDGILGPILKDIPKL